MIFYIVARSSINLDLPSSYHMDMCDDVMNLFMLLRRVLFISCYVPKYFKYTVSCNSYNSTSVPRLMACKFFNAYLTI